MTAYSPADIATEIVTTRLKFNLETGKLIVAPDTTPEEANAAKQVAIDLIALVTVPRFFTVFNIERINALWKQIRENESLSDLVIGSTIELQLALPGYTDKTFDDVIHDLATAYSSFVKWAGESTEKALSEWAVDDDELYQRMATHVDISNFLRANPWLVLLLLLEPALMRL